MTWEGTKVYPVGDEQYSNDVIAPHFAAWAQGEPCQLIALYDVWAIKPEAVRDIPHKAAWMPVDHVPVPPECEQFLKASGTLPIAMSRFGEEQLRIRGFEPRYAPHGIDLKVFQPTELLGGRPPRKWWGIDDDRFVVTINANNKGRVPPRKAFSEMFQALAAFMRARPDVFAYFHCDSRPFGGGIDLGHLAASCAMPKGRYAFVDPYTYQTASVTDSDVAAIYTASDVLLSTSMGEGFGLPVIVSDATAQPELVGAGWAVEGQPEWDHFQGAYLFRPFIHSIVEALEAAYASRGEHKGEAMAKAAEYDIDTVYPTFWRPILAEMEANLTPPKVKKAAAKRERRARR